MDRVARLLALLAAATVVLPAGTQDPCTNATLLHEASRRTNSSSSSNGICDTRITHTWYRVNTGTGSDLVTSCPVLGAGCGTSFPVWLHGAVPEVGEGEVTRSVCQTSLLSCCEQTWTVRVQNCGAYRVWKLPPTSACPQAYCFEGDTFSLSPHLSQNACTARASLDVQRSTNPLITQFPR